MTGRFEGKKVMITGAARGQGRNHAIRFAREGADVALVDIALPEMESIEYPLASSGDLAETVRLVEGEGRKALGIEADVRDLNLMHEAVASTTSELGGLDVLVVNAGICSFSPIEDLDPQTWQTMIDVNLTGAFNSVRAAIAPMLDNGYGRVVATSSMAGRAGWENIGHYAASKWGLIGMIKSLALEVADRGVTANVVCPSSVNTTMMHNEASYKLFRPDIAEPTMEDALPAFQSLNVIPVPYAETEDISDSVLFLASDEARFITGATLSPSTGVNAKNV